jgi:hypothetical protein
MVHQGMKEAPLLLINGSAPPAQTAPSSTSRLEATMDLNSSSISISIGSTTGVNSKSEVFTSSIGRLHVQSQSGVFRQLSPLSPALANILLDSDLSGYEHYAYSNVSSGTSNTLEGVDVRIAGHLEHCVQLSNLGSATAGKSLAAFSSMHVAQDIKQNGLLDITVRNGSEFGVGGVLHLAEAQYKFTEKLKAVTQEPSKQTATDLQYTVSWQAHQSTVVEGNCMLKSFEGLEISTGQFGKQEFVNSVAHGVASLLEFPQTLALLQSSCALYPANNSSTIKSVSSRVSSTGAPVAGHRAWAAGTVAAALRCVVNERSEVKGSSLFTAQYTPKWGFETKLASNDAYGVELTGGVEVVPRLLPTAASTNATKAASLTPIAKTWAISGGNGALGQLSSDWLSKNGTSHQVLLCRSGRFKLGDSAPEGLFDSTSQGMITVQQ